MTATTNYAWTKPDATTNVRIWEWVGTFLDQIDASLAAEAAFRADIVSKRTSDLPRALTTTLVADTQITGIPLVSGATYKLDAFLFHKADPAGDFKFGWTCTGTGATLLWTPNGANAASTGEDHSALTLVDAGTIGGITATGAGQCATPGGILYAGTGTPALALTWAQGTSSTNGTTVLSGSTVVLHRIS